MIELQVNGRVSNLDVDADRSLLAVLRDELDLTGAKYGCGEGQCGACLVLVNGQPLPACITSIGAVAGCDVLTVEGLACDGRLHPLQQAFLDQEAFQCGYCTPGMLIAGIALLNRNGAPTRQEIVSALQPNLCRCGAYSRIVCAVQQAAAARTSQAEAVAP
jgi:nicotinate dehydrogenase subunit A